MGDSILLIIHRVASCDLLATPQVLFLNSNHNHNNSITITNHPTPSCNSVSTASTHLTVYHRTLPLIPCLEI